MDVHTTFTVGQMLHLYRSITQRRSGRRAVLGTPGRSGPAPFGQYGISEPAPSAAPLRVHDPVYVGVSLAEELGR